MALPELNPAIQPGHPAPVTQWTVTLLITESMPYVEDSRKAVIADRLMTAIPHSNVRVMKMRELKPEVEE